MRKNFHSTKKINFATQHDIKLELDVRCQKRIETILSRAHPEMAILGEEGVAGDMRARYRWVVDPIDGTVNFTYGIPHCCVSIALQVESPKVTAQVVGQASRLPAGRLAPDPTYAGETPDDAGETPAPLPEQLRPKSKARSRSPLKAQPAYQTIVGVVYDPFCEELWTATLGGAARMNGRVIRVSNRNKLREAIVSIGFAKHSSTMEKMLPTFNGLIHRVRKVRMMGAAALSMVYVASGRMDAYLEYGLRLWDIAAGGLILECAGGDFWNRPLPGEHTYQVLANNGLLRRQLQRFNS